MKLIPLLVFEDDHLLVVNKPPGINTHAPSPYAGEGIYDWLRNREPRWAKLSIIHRLDKETSGVMVFGKTSLANRSLTDQFTARTVRKKYVLLTDRPVRQPELTIKTTLVRTGDKYIPRPVHPGADLAETRFKLLPEIVAQIHKAEKLNGPLHVIEAQPLTGRTHQIRVHAAHLGFPILGDTLYGGTAARRLYLHAETIAFKHPASDEELTFLAEAEFEADRSTILREALIEPALTNAYRLIHGEWDGCPGWYVDRLGDFLLSQGERPPNASQNEKLAELLKHLSSAGVYHKTLTRRASQASQAEASPRHCFGQTAPERFRIQENGLQFELSFDEGYSVGLFLDQRDNRRRLLNGYVAAGFDLPVPRSRNAGPEMNVLNTFAYTCGFSVCAAKAGARTTNLDLSKKYLEWGKRNFELNKIDTASHEFIFGDVFDWLRRLDKKGRRFEVILLDPPTFSKSKEYGVFRVEKNYGELVTAALRLLKPGGILFASTNAADWSPEKFLASVEGAIQAAKKTVLRSHYVGQPLDFSPSRSDPAYLKTVWLQIDSKGCD